MGKAVMPVFTSGWSVFGDDKGGMKWCGDF